MAARYPGIRVLYMSVYRDDVVGRRDVIGRPGVPDDGVNDIQKPFPVKTLATKVHELLGR